MKLVSFLKILFGSRKKRPSLFSEALEEACRDTFKEMGYFEDSFSAVVGVRPDTDVKHKRQLHPAEHQQQRSVRLGPGSRLCWKLHPAEEIPSKK